MPVLNLKTNQLEDLDAVATAEGLASGTHIPPQGQGVLISPENELVFLPASGIKDSIQKYGYRIPQPDEIRKAGRDYKYNSDEQQLQAALAGAARGASFGASDYLAVKTGITSPEHLSALKEYFPGTSIAGEIGGALATAPFSFTPAGAAVRGARALETAAVGKAAAMLPKSAMASAIAKTAVETGGKALGGAVEGLAFGLGQTVSEAALGDPDLTAEKVVAHLGQSAILGGALGASFNVGSIALKKTLEKSKKVYQSAYEKLIGKTVISPEAVGEQAGIPGFNVADLGDDLSDEVSGILSKEIAEEQAQAAGQPVFEPGILTKKLAKASSVTSGVPEEEILEKFAGEMDPKRIVLTTAERDAKVKTFGENLQAIYNTSNKLMSSVSKYARPQEMEGLLVDVSLEKPSMQLMDVFNAMENAKNAMAKEPLLYKPGITRELEQMVERLEKNIVNGYTDSYSVYKELVTNRQLLEDMEMFNKINLSREEKKSIFEFIQPLRAQIREGLMDQNVWGQAGARQAAYNEKFSALKRWTEALEKTVMKKELVGEARPVYEINDRKINMMFNQINDTRSRVPGRATSNYLKAFREYLEEAENSIKNAPDSKIDVGAIKDFTGKLADEAVKAKQYVADAFGGYGFFRDLMDAAKSGGLGGMAAQIGTAFTNPDALVRGLSKIEKMAKATDKAMQKTKVIFEKIKPPTKGIGVLWEGLSPSERATKYKEYVDKLKNLTDVPDFMLDSLESATNETFEAAPKITQGIQMALVRGTSFLLQKMPKPIDQNLLDTPYQPSQAEIVTFGRYVAVVENPTIVLDQLEANYIPKESIETLREVYPSFYASLKTQILEQLTNKLADDKLKVPYQRRVVLSRFLEMPLDSTMKPGILQRNQQVLQALYAEEQKKEAARQSRPSQAGLREVSLSERSATNLEKVANRT